MRSHSDVILLVTSGVGSLAPRECPGLGSADLANLKSHRTRAELGMPVSRTDTEGPVVGLPGLHSDSVLTEAGLESSSHTRPSPLRRRPRGSAFVVWGPGSFARHRSHCPHLSELALSPTWRGPSPPATSPCFIPSVGTKFRFLFHCCLFVCSFICACLRLFVRHSCSFIHSQTVRRRVRRSWRGIPHSQPGVCGPISSSLLLCLKKRGWSSSSCVQRMAVVMSCVCVSPSLLPPAS